MSNNKNLFKEAIADAKALREAALLNAKNALEEALTPSIQNMLTAKLNEMGAEDDFEENYDESGEVEDVSMEEDFDLSAILAELEGEDQLEEAKKKDEKAEDEAEDEKAEDEAEETKDGEKEVGEMSVEELKTLIKDIVSQELEAEENETLADETSEEIPMDLPMDVDAGADMALGAEEDEINLEELLAELDSMDEYAESTPEDMLAAICIDYPDHHACGGMKENKFDEVRKVEEELKEAIGVISTLRNELKENNLLNAKLIYVNKIFKSKNLSESQKLRVIASFDKAATPKEAKIVYESLSGTLNKETKRHPIKESMGFASKAAGVAPRKQIVESNDVILRMQKLANIIK